MMRHNLQYVATAVVITAVACCVCSCKGRRADATPNGETVQVNVAEPANDTVGGQLQPADSGGVVTTVTSNRDNK